MNVASKFKYRREPPKNKPKYERKHKPERIPATPNNSARTCPECGQISNCFSTPYLRMFRIGKFRTYNCVCGCAWKERDFYSPFSICSKHKWGYEISGCNPVRCPDGKLALATLNRRYCKKCNVIQVCLKDGWINNRDLTIDDFPE